MNKMMQFVVGGVSGIALTLAVSAMATGTNLHGEGGHGLLMSMSSGERMQFFHQHMEKRVAEMHDALSLNAGQEVAWQRFVDSTKDRMTQAHAIADALGLKPESMKTLPVPQRLDKWQSAHNQMTPLLEAEVADIKVFYAQLDAGQQKIFDEKFRFHPHE